MKGLFIPDITAEMFRNGCLEGIEALMAEGEIYDIEYSPWIPCSERLPDSRRSVLITVSNGKNYETCEAYYHELRKDWFEVNGDRVCEMSPRWKTIAWCELPEPYKGDQK